MDEIIRRAGALPAAEIAGTVNEVLTERGAVVITAPPGAGKSTLLPLTMLTVCSGRIIMLEPRRLAARQIAERMAALLDEPLGATVGYRVRFEKAVSAKTRIEVVTEGILTRMLVADPTLDGIDLVIFDEFHERSIHSDLALALTGRVRQLLRPELKIAVMSATIDATQICRHLGAVAVNGEGRMFPVEVHHAAVEPDRADMVRAAAEAVLEAVRRQPGDVLVFLPGQADIERCAALLAGSLEGIGICPLYGNLPPEQQRRAIRPSAEGQRKVVLSTPVAETSLTIEGVRTVIDSGLCRTPVFDRKTGLSRLETVRISLDMAAQRTGRAGRVAPGVCHRLWTAASEHRMDAARKPEILSADLAPMLLDIAAFGETDLTALPWLTPPPAGNVAQAAALLRMLGALGEDGTITPAGRRMAALPCHPRLARMMLQAVTPALQSLAADIAALLEEKDPLNTDTDGADMLLRIQALRAARQKGTPGRWTRMARVAEAYAGMLRCGISNAPVAAEDIGMLVAYAFPERVAMASDNNGRYRLASGDNVQLDPHDALSAYPFLAIASLHTTGQTGRVFLASPVDAADLSGLCTERVNVSWDSRQGGVVTQQERRIGRLLVESRPVHDVPRGTVVSVICEAVAREGRSMLDWNDDVARLQRRVAQAALWHPELGIPDISAEAMMADAASWLPPFLENGGRLRTTVAELKKVDLAAALWAFIPYPLQQQIDRLAPSHLQVPTGSRIRVDYRAGAEAPVLSVRLQECFGLADTPCVDGGTRPVLMELLSPGYKPVQLTKDLRSFWQRAYFDVRKELRPRYPKHYWPDNPLEAESVRGVRRSR